MLTLIEARPGAGKTTMLQRLAELLRQRGVTLAGFVSEEIREGGRRAGFSIETFAGERGTLAHQNLPGPPRVGTGSRSETLSGSLFQRSEFQPTRS